ncbi:tRNA (adenosine(37)-N6)-threonylcarbamoyltransferase complex ATPase subunit type 1 TsaE [Acuticoccus sp. MNP-M23]|uniref:tRNA (adenosine(37)-N6)-threonylcarbamoyltransferase complex ATPase subunit type 1 TsaE n=1 Tax=Acuticoccus sp. MNP-M23 TaxID=3072793 RepID=UPI0028161203|nr:tRNA (adenosine(37)-N6)-threonylcarbamoyltransferase complex ATPase subunit type 1 TsaE [Acuticoccus sp. MNP-M23]WMS44211.1 tRNA (adenosine(37)-N6)-threonylcarbamoyltransferase complex ATPase subunit type 1 TsaE [Acuticoccus sp. MNP-M23]
MTLTLAIEDEAAMARLGADIASVLATGDRVALIGDLGAGKTTLARAILRALAEDPAMEVPSPTFTIVQAYDGRIPVRHVDLYRVTDPAEMDELGLGEPDAAELIEWPREPLPITLTIQFAEGDEARTVTLDAPAPWAARFARRQAMHGFIAAAGWGDAAVLPLKQDASTRSYVRLVRPDESAVLMNAPSFVPAPDSYPARARLADGNNNAFLAVGALLRGCGLSAPAVHAADAQEGFILLEDLGDGKIAEDGAPVEERYLAAADALAAFHETGTTAPPAYTPPRFDADLAALEVTLFMEWLLKSPVTPEYDGLWRAAIGTMWRGDDRLALRDYHSPNCLWLPAREGIARIGIIDYQDAMIAPSAYDVVSLAQDARVAIPRALEGEIIARYLAGRTGLDMALWHETYALLGAQRATRIAGVFRRLNDRDGKPQYLQHIPRMKATIAQNLAAAPALAPLAAWFAENTDVMDTQ